MKILVVGGGMAGLGFAGFMQDHAQVTIIEKASHWGDVGFAIMLWGNGQKLLRELGAENEVLKEAYELPWAAILSKEGKLLSDIALDDFKDYERPLIVTRTTLHKALIKTLHPKTRVFFKTTVSNLIQEDHGVHVTLSNGVTEFYDLVIGADGVHSQVRDMVFGTDFLKPFGWNVWTFWSPRSEANSVGAFDFIGKGQAYVTYPMEDRTVIGLVAAGKQRLDIPLPELKLTLKQMFGSFHNSVNYMIDSVEDPAKIFHDHLMHVEMSLWYKGRVALMGDAQHASSPLLGMGTSMALEDGYVLAQELKRIGSSRDIPLALENYAKRRGGRVKAYRAASHIFDEIMILNSPILVWIRRIAFQIMPTRIFTKTIQGILNHKL